MRVAELDRSSGETLSGYRDLQRRYEAASTRLKQREAPICQCEIDEGNHLEALKRRQETDQEKKLLRALQALEQELALSRSDANTAQDRLRAHEMSNVELNATIDRLESELNQLREDDAQLKEMADQSVTSRETLGAELTRAVIPTPPQKYADREVQTPPGSIIATRVSVSIQTDSEHSPPPKISVDISIQTDGIEKKDHEEDTGLPKVAGVPTSSISSLLTGMSDVISPPIATPPCTLNRIGVLLNPFGRSQSKHGLDRVVVSEVSCKSYGGPAVRRILLLCICASVTALVLILLGNLQNHMPGGSAYHNCLAWTSFNSIQPGIVGFSVDRTSAFRVLVGPRCGIAGKFYEWPT